VKDTNDVQNTLRRLRDDVDLNVDGPTTAIKRQYSKALIALENARLQFDILNDMKDELAK